jgi:hypothetical protein
MSAGNLQPEIIFMIIKIYCLYSLIIDLFIHSLNTCALEKYSIDHLESFMAGKGV